jgi:hypothetical protein
MLRINSGVVICEINGGVGNQLFQVSTGFCLAKQNQAKLILDLIGCDSSTSYDGSWHLGIVIKEMQKDMQIIVLRSNSFYKKLFRKIIMMWYKPTRINRELIRRYYKDNILASTEDKCVYIPTDEDNFFGEEAVRLGFKLYFEKLRHNYVLSNNNKKTLAIHIRRGNLTPDNIHYKAFFVPDEWYLQKLNLFSQSDYNFVCFTDSINKNDLLHFSQYKFLVYGKELGPLEAILRLSTYNYLILSKSTFSFWAAALSDAEIIISPFDSDHRHKPFNSNYSFR